MHLETFNFKENNPFVKKYIHAFDEVAQFFSYQPFSNEELKRRAKTLQNDDRFNREALVEVLDNYNRKINNSKQALEQIERLKDPRSSVVIGGQQAGIMTGPLYAVYKAVQIIKMAQEAERELGSPVIPVFWIAGEDHDWDEVNHINQLEADCKPVQHKIKYRPESKRSVSHMSIPQDTLHQFIDDVTEKWSQTANKEGLRQALHTFAEQSSNLTDFFALTMVYLFGQYGLVLIDSADSRFRSLQCDHFIQLISKNESLHRAIRETERKFIKAGFSPQLELHEDQSHLFIYLDSERTLLERKDGGFVAKDHANVFTQEKLVELAYRNPEQLSTNVVFRALMQEFMFPTLQFIGGTSEVSYWALYKDMFEVLGLELPIIVPRVGFTLIDRTAQKHLEKYELTYEQLLYAIDCEREIWFDRQDDLGLREKFDNLTKEIKSSYEAILPVLAKINGGVSDLAIKNLDYVISQVHYLDNRANKAYRNKFEVGLGHFERLKALCLPDGKLQERFHNPFYFINEYGYEWLNELINHGMRYEKQHYIALL